MKTAQIIFVLLAACFGTGISTQANKREEQQDDNTADDAGADATETTDSDEVDSTSEAKPVSKSMDDQDAQTDEQRLLAEEGADKTELIATSSKAHASAASSSESADGYDETEKSLDLFHKTYAKEKQEAKHLRQELTKATKYGKDLQKRLRGNLKAFNEKTRQTQLFMARKAKEDASAMQAEKKREHILESLFAKVNRSLVERSQDLFEARTELNATRKERATLSASALRALRAERKQEAKLQAQLGKSKAAVKASKSKLDHENAELKVARTEWKAEEMRLLKAERAESARNAVLESNLSVLVTQVRSLKGAKQQEDQVLSSFKVKSKQAVQDAQQKLSAARSRELTLRKALDGDHKKGEHEIATLTKELAVWKKRANNAQASAKQLGREVKLRASGDKEEMGELKKKLASETHEAQDLSRQRSELDAEVQGNATRRSKLEEEVQRLRQQLREGEVARKKAEAIAKKAQADTAQAQAVAKQLSGTVPRLLEQAQLAHERRDAMAAMKQEQVANMASSTSSVATKTPSNDTTDELSQLPADELASEVEQAADADDKVNTSTNTTASTDTTNSADTVAQKFAADTQNFAADTAAVDSDANSQPAASLDSDSDGLTQLLSED